MSDALGFLPGTKPDVAEGWRKVLLDAADYIDKHGWCQHRADTTAGSVCLMGALGRSQGFPHGPWMYDAPRAVSKAAKRMAQYLGADGDQRFSAPADFNDTPGRTASEVTAALRACARQ